MNGTRIGIIGCGGRMGRMLVQAAQATPGAIVAGGSEMPGSPHAGADLGTLAGLPPLGVACGTDTAALFQTCDVVVDFTIAAASRGHAELAAAASRALVIGTTGLDADETRAVEASATKAPILWAANFSLGVNVLLGLAEQVARALGPDYDIEVVEMHHRHKVDAPSGTALALGRALAKGRGVELDAVAQRVRDGHTGPRRAGDIGFATLRGGDVVGDHMIVLAGPGERIELGHRASSREVFAHGAIRAALWVAGRKPGLYGMKDVLGL